MSTTRSWRSVSGDEIFEAFENKCVTVHFSSGRTVTGFFRAVEENLLLLFVAGRLELVSLFTVETITLAARNAC